MNLRELVDQVAMIGRSHKEMCGNGLNLPELKEKLRFTDGAAGRTHWRLQ